MQGLLAAPLKIALISEGTREAHRTFESALRQELSSHPGIQILQQHLRQDAELLIAIGEHSAVSVVGSRVPVLNVMVTRGGTAALLPNSGGKMSSIYLDQPFARQLALLHAALPDAKSVGVLYSSIPAGLGQLKRQSADAGLILQSQEVPDHSLLSNRLSALLGISDVLLVLPDAEIYRTDTIRNILLATYRLRIPMIGLTQSYVRAGALCAIYSTPEQIARQTAEVITLFAHTRTLPGDQYPKEFEVAVNTQVVRSLGLTIKSAEQLRAEAGSAK